jgi:hypothetical protein
VSKVQFIVNLKIYNYANVHRPCVIMTLEKERKCKTIVKLIRFESFDYISS